MKLDGMIDIEPLLLKVKNRRLVVTAALAAAGLFAGGLLVLKPGLERLSGITSQIADLKQKVPVYQFLLESEKRTAAYKTRFSGDKSWLTEQLNSIGEETGLSILSVLPEDPKKVGDFLEETTVRIDAESNYHQLGEFVSRVESLDAYVKILRLDIDTENASSANSNPGPQGGGDVYPISVSVGLFTPTAGVL